jgi:glycolate oxidase FAD binding subunit
LYLRLSGAASAVSAACKALGGALIEDAAALWRSVREHTHPALASPLSLWRLSVPSTVAPLNFPGAQLIEWGGALRWVASDAEASSIRAAVEKFGGSAMLFRRGAGDTASAAVFHPLKAEIAQLNERLKLTFDPARILNPGRMYRAS